MYWIFLPIPPSSFNIQFLHDFICRQMFQGLSEYVGCKARVPRKSEAYMMTKYGEAFRGAITQQMMCYGRPH